MTVLILLLLAAPAFALTLFPLFRPKPQVAAGRSVREEELADLHSRRDTMYEALKDLEFEYQSGGLSERDYRDLEGKYKDRAIALIKRLDSATAPGGVEDEIEEQVRRLRNVKKETPVTPTPHAGDGDEVEDQIMRLRTMKREACPACKAEYQKGDRFCSKCGARL